MSNTTEISRTCLIVKTHVGLWAGNLTDRELSVWIDKQRKAETGSYKANVKLFKTDPKFRRMLASWRRLRTFVDEQTISWSHGMRIMRAIKYDKFRADYRHLVEIAEADTAEFFEPAYYREAINADRTRLGEDFNPDYYPPADYLRAKYWQWLEVEQLPKTGFQIKGMPKALADELSEAVQQQADARIARASNKAWQRTHQAISHLIDKLDNYKVGEAAEANGGRSYFQDNLIDNLAELCDILPQINITADPALDKVGERLRAEVVEKFTVEGLKDSEGMRAQAAKRARKLLSTVEKNTIKPEDEDEADKLAAMSAI